MKNKSYLGLLGIPLAVLGIVGSVAFAQSAPQAATPTVVQNVTQTSGDKEVPDKEEANDQSDVSGNEIDTPDSPGQDTDQETNDGADTGNADGETNDDGAPAAK